MNNVALDASGVGSVPEFWMSTSKVKRDFMFPFRSSKTTVCMFGSIDAFGTLMKAVDHSSHPASNIELPVHTHTFTQLCTLFWGLSGSVVSLCKNQSL